MIIQAAIVLIIILVVANIFVGIVNSCFRSHVENSVDEYFNVKKQSRSVDGLDTIVPHTQLKKNNTSYLDYMEYSEEDDQNKVHAPATSNIYAVLDSMFSTSKPDNETRKGVSDYNGTGAAVFEVDFEGVPADNDHRSGLKKLPPSSIVGVSQRDGYSDR